MMWWLAALAVWLLVGLVLALLLGPCMRDRSRPSDGVAYLRDLLRDDDPRDRP